MAHSCLGHCPLGRRGPQGRWGRGVLTHKVRQQDDQCGRDGNGAQGRALPVTVLGGLLEVEGRAGEGGAGQGPGRRRVHRAGRQRVARRRAAEERGGASRLEEEVPVDGEKPGGGRVSRLPGSPHRPEGRGSGRRSMQKSLERRRERERESPRRRRRDREKGKSCAGPQNRAHGDTFPRKHGWDSPAHREPTPAGQKAGC